MNPEQRAGRGRTAVPANKGEENLLDAQRAFLAAIAAHEAGHAVIGYVLGRRWPRLLRVHIQRSKTRYGHCICKKWPQRSTTYRTWARRVGADILVSLAGPIAEARAGGRPHVWNHTDTRELVVDVASVIWANGVLFANGGEPIPLEVVKAGTDHVRRSLPQAEEMVDKYWASIEAVARELLAHTSVPGKRVAEVVDATVLGSLPDLILLPIPEGGER